MKLLLHTCCAPCLVKCAESLRGEGLEPVLYWYNPNIHPVVEYRARRDALAAYAEGAGLALETEDVYGLRAFVAAVSPDFDGRCAHCYRVRMEAAAAFAAGHGYDAFSTTLLISPYQKHELLRQTAEAAAARHGVDFLYRDFRPLFRSGQQAARDMGLYRQKYCGCVFSEEERYGVEGRSRRPSK
ncbi:MAG: epoxyqueuosine reductase QueH [Oscillospiraceae bacterium]|nr:epoxyqueuosine reductase QueH [Oscillospiraceae bacterium]